MGAMLDQAAVKLGILENLKSSRNADICENMEDIENIGKNWKESSVCD